LLSFKVLNNHANIISLPSSRFVYSTKCWAIIAAPSGAVTFQKMTQQAFSDELHVLLYNIPSSKEKPFKLFVNSKEVINIKSGISAKSPQSKVIKLENPKHAVVHNIWIQCVVDELQLDKVKLYNLTKGGYYLKIFINSDNLLSIMQYHEQSNDYSIVDAQMSRFVHLSPSRKDEVSNLAMCLRKRFITEEDYVNDVNRILEEAENDTWSHIELTDEQRQEIAHLHRYVERNVITESEFSDVREDLLNCYKDFADGKISDPIFKKRKQRILGELDWEKNLDQVQIERRGKELPQDAHLARYGLIKPQTALEQAKEKNSRQFSPTYQDISTNSVKPVNVTLTRKDPISPMSKTVDLTQLTKEDQEALDQLIELKNMGVFSEQDFQMKRDLLFEKSREKYQPVPVSPVESKVVIKARPLAPAMAVNMSNGSPTGVVDQSKNNMGVFKGHFLSYEEGFPVKSSSPSNVSVQRKQVKGLSQQDAEDLKQLTALRDEGVLTQEEFDVHRKKILFG
jgi:hypothetical protein